MIMDSRKIIDSMIEWLDTHQHDGMDPQIRAALDAEDPRTWADVHGAGIVTDDDVVNAWLAAMARS